MPAYQSFLSGDNLITFWNNVKWFLFLVAPIIMIFFATDVIGHLVSVIRGTVDDKEKRQDDDDDDIYYY